ncbi:MAG: hypothetical protein AAEJ52_01395 [Myxococcota bacterium]
MIAFVAAACIMVGPAVADDRPSEIVTDAPGAASQLDPSYRMTSHKVVLITDQALNPRTVTLEAGQLVAWISYSGAASTVVFEREIARSMVCHSLVNFSIKDDELRSSPIRAGEFASFCELKPGKYDYKVVRPNANLVAGSDARKMLEGQIIIGNE